MSELDNNQRENTSSLGRPRTQSIFSPITPATINLENIMDYTNVCRVCANVTENMVPILRGEGRQLNLSHKLAKHLKIYVLQRDYPRMPVVLCMSCTNTLLAFDEMVSGARVVDAALRRHYSLYVNRREMEQRQERINRNLEENGVRRCPLCSAAIATSRYSAHLRTRHVSQQFQCGDCHSLVERHELVAHIKEHADRLATDWSVILASVTGRRRTGHQIALVHPEIVEIEFSDSDGEHFEPSLDSVFRTIETPPASIQTPQEPEVVLVQDDTPQESLVSENPHANSRQESLLSEHPPANSPQESLVSEYPPAKSPQESLVSENPPPNSPVVLNDELQKDGEEIKLEKKPTRSCPHCSRTFKASSSFFYHIKYYHNQSKEHACDKCGKRFGTRGMLREHASVHTGARELQCGQCPKKFRTKASLYIHQQTHGAVKKYSCNQCPMAFRWNTQLQRHLTRHAAERKHACATCGKAFSVRADLLRHGRTHARAEHACPEAPCAARFAQPRYLRSHVTRKHANASRGAEK